MSAKEWHELLFGAILDAPEEDRSDMVDRNKGTRTYQRYSICECGFPILNDGIPLGRVYEVDEESVRGGVNMRCGGCGNVLMNLSVIDAREEPSGRFAPLPLAIFEPEVTN